MGMINFEEVTPEEDYIVVEKYDITQTESGIYIQTTGLNLVKVIAGVPMSPGELGILLRPPEINLGNGQFITAKKNLVGKAKQKEAKSE